MTECSEVRPRLVELLRGGVRGGAPGQLLEHVDACPRCTAELRELRASWDELPEPAPTTPSPRLREAVLDRAREAVGPAPAAAPAGSGRMLAAVWGVARASALLAASGVAAAAAVVGALHLGTGLAVRSALPILAAGLVLATGLAGAFGGLQEGRHRPAVRAILVGALASFGGYVLLAVLHPISSTVEFCRLRVLGDPVLTTGQICLVYAAVSALYAGLPVAAGVWWSAPVGDGWRAGLAEGVVFTLLVLPVLVLEFGLESVAVTGTVILGIVVGAAAGGVAAGLPRRKRVAGANP